MKVKIESDVFNIINRIKEIDEDIIGMRKFIGDEHARRYRIAKEKLQDARTAKQQLDILLRRYKESNASQLRAVCFISYILFILIK